MMQAEVRLGLPTVRISREIRDGWQLYVAYFGLIVPRPGLGLPGMPNVPFFGRAQIVLKWCSKRMLA